MVHIVNMQRELKDGASFALQLRMRRRLKKLSLRDLSAALGGAVSHEMLSRYEKGIAKPRPEVYEQLCDLLEIQESAAYTPVIAMDSVKFRRSRWNLPQKELAAVKALAVEHCNRYLKLECLMGECLEWQSPFTRAEQRRLVRVMKESKEKTALMEEMADSLRVRWQLGSGPITSLSTLLERKGVLICELPFLNNRLDGFSFVHEGKPIICVADWLNRNPARKRMTLAHELGHILFPEVDADMDSDKEYCIMRFAGALLMPQAEVRAALGSEPRRELPLYMLLELKHYFGISLVGLMARAMQLKIIDWEQYSDYNRRFFKQFYAQPAEKQLEDLEPGQPYSVADASSRFSTLVSRAVSTGVIDAHAAVERFGVQPDETLVRNLL